MQRVETNAFDRSQSTCHGARRKILQELHSETGATPPDRAIEAIISNDLTILHKGPVTLPVLLSRNFVGGGDQYASRFSLPVEETAFSTERKVVGEGEGRQLQRFLNSPVHSSPISPSRTRAPSRKLPKWIYNAVERYVVQSGRRHKGYTFELVGIGEPSITWHLKRLVSRRAMRYNPVKLWGGEQARKALAANKPLMFESEKDKLMIDHWLRRIHYVLRANAFNEKAEMDRWIARERLIASRQGGGKTKAIVRRGADPIVSNPPAGSEGRPWFNTVGWYAFPQSLLSHMRRDAQEFAFSGPSDKRLFRAYIARGPDNPILNFFNLPLEAGSLNRRRCPSGTVFTEFNCDLRLEIYE